MKEDLLDDGIIERLESKKTRLANWTALMLLWAGIGWCITSGLFMEWPVLLAVTVLAVITILFYLQHDKQIAILLLGGTLLAAAMGILVFFPISFSIILPLDLIPIFVLVLLMATNRDTYAELVLAIKGDQEQVHKERKAAKSARFLSTFRKKSTSELRAIVTDRRLVPEAIEAAEILLAEREKKGQ